MTLTMAPARPASLHVRDRGLHEEERAAQVDGDVLVEQLRGGVEQRAARGQAGGVDQAVDPAVAARSSRRPTACACVDVD